MYCKFFCPLFHPNIIGRDGTLVNIKGSRAEGTIGASIAERWAEKEEAAIKNRERGRRWLRIIERKTTRISHKQG